MDGHLTRGLINEIAGRRADVEAIKRQATGEGGKGGEQLRIDLRESLREWAEQKPLLELHEGTFLVLEVLGDGGNGIVLAVAAVPETSIRLAHSVGLAEDYRRQGAPRVDPHVVYPVGTILTAENGWDIRKLSNANLQFGSSAEVQMSRKLRSKPFAVKLLASVDEQAIRRFEAEFAATLRNLPDSPLLLKPMSSGTALIPILDGEPLRVYYTTMDKCKANLEHSGLRFESLEQVQVLLTFLLDSVGILHENSVVHRDIKPENILVREDGSLVLADYGVAYFGREVELGVPRITKIGERIRNSMFSAPEQDLPNTEAAATMDIWAIASVIQWAVTGQTAKGHGQRSLASFNPQLGGLDPVIQQMLQNDQANRPQSISAVRGVVFPSSFRDGPGLAAESADLDRDQLLANPASDALHLPAPQIQPEKELSVTTASESTQPDQSPASNPGLIKVKNLDDLLRELRRLTLDELQGRLGSLEQPFKVKGGYEFSLRQMRAGSYDKPDRVFEFRLYSAETDSGAIEAPPEASKMLLRYGEETGRIAQCVVIALAPTEMAFYQKRVYETGPDSFSAVMSMQTRVKTVTEIKGGIPDHEVWKYPFKQVGGHFDQSVLDLVPDGQTRLVLPLLSATALVSQRGKRDA